MNMLSKGYGFRYSILIVLLSFYLCTQGLSQSSLNASVGLSTNNIIKSESNSRFSLGNYSYVFGIQFRDIFDFSNSTLSSSIHYRNRIDWSIVQLTIEPNIKLDNYRFLLPLRIDKSLGNDNLIEPNNYAFNFGVGLSRVFQVKNSKKIEISFLWSNTFRAFSNWVTSISGVSSYEEYWDVASFELMFSYSVFTLSRI